MKSILFLFTKKFPYGIQETYLFDELPYLSNSFKEIIIVPHDEFEYRETENRIRNTYSNIIVFPINNKLVSLNGFDERVHREWTAYSILLYELFFASDKLNHLKHFFQLIGQLRHLYSSAVALKEFICNSRYNHTQILFYNYWLHRGVIISGIFNKISRMSPVKVIARAHSFDVYHHDWFRYLSIPNNLFLPFQRWKLKHVCRVYPISEHGHKYLLKKFYFLKSNCKVSRLGVRLVTKKKDFVYTNENLLWVTCSWGTANKRLYLVPEIMRNMKTRIRWVHLGGADYDQIKEINERVKKYNLTDWVTIYSPLPRHEVLNFYSNNQIDLFLNLSLAEGIPVALMEAAVFGIPLLATNVVGTSEIVNNENGFLVEVNFCPKEVAEKLNTFFADSQAVNRKRQASYQTFENMYNADRNYPEFINELRYY